MNGGQVHGQSHSQQSFSDGTGTTVTTQSQNLGEPAVRETRQYDNHGRELVGGPMENGSNRITDVEQAERDREYEERIEEEYAKREGGA